MILISISFDYFIYNLSFTNILKNYFGIITDIFNKKSK